jgi:hypothetical protein
LVLSVYTCKSAFISGGELCMKWYEFTEEDKERYEKLLKEYEELNHWGTEEPLY